KASPSPDVRHYHVYFSADARPKPVQARRVVSPPRSCTSYLDWTAPRGGRGWYALTAVDRQGNESVPVYAEAAP
ncbi:MAG: hypothetical protein QHJ73_17315, partial [Armatimonadota bacterium]|nr:hypothetical protein [Armatimonadota bacterium]